MATSPNQYSPVPNSDVSISSPTILKPMIMNQNQRSMLVTSITLNRKMRSMLVTSISLNHSNAVGNFGGIVTGCGGGSISQPGIVTPIVSTPTLRSMSIVSLDSPRNSIGSAEDIKLTRNSSFNSVASLANIHSGSNLIPITPKPDLINCSSLMKVGDQALLSDDDFELYHSPSKILRPMLKADFEKESKSVTTNLKRDFDFNYDNHMHTVTSPPHNLVEAPSPLSLKQDIRPIKPLSIDAKHDIISDINVSSERIHGDRIKSDRIVQNDRIVQSDRAIQSDRIHNDKGDRIVGDKSDASEVSKKKLKPNSIQQSIILKKKLIYSKELQFELINNLSPTSVSSLSSMMDSRFLTPNSISENKLTSYTKQPVLETLTQKNKLIEQLNQKWNKSSEKDVKPKLGRIQLKPSANFQLSRKRRFLSDDDEVSDIDSIGPL